MQLNKPLNPFINALHVPYIEYVTDVKHVQGETKVYGFEAEADEHIRLYTSRVKREFIFNTLTDKARELYFMILYSLNREYDYVVFSYEKVQSLQKSYAIRRFADGMRDLIRYSVLDVKDKAADAYWYNPLYFSTGNRLKMFPQCKVKVKTTHVRMMELDR